MVGVGVTVKIFVLLLSELDDSYGQKFMWHLGQTRRRL